MTVSVARIVGPADFVYGSRDDLGQRATGHLLTAVDVLDHHDRIVDQNADGEDQGEQRDPVEGEAPRPRREQRGGQSEHDCDTNDQRFAPPERDEHERDDRQRREDELLDQLGGLVACRFSVVARDSHPHAFGNDRALHQLRGAHHAPSYLHRILTGLLRHADRYRGILARLDDALLLRLRPEPDPHVARRLVRPVLDTRHVAHVDRTTVEHTDDQLSHVRGTGQIGAGLDQNLAVVLHEIA